MRKAMMTMAALSIAGLFGGASPAAAYDYPYCLQGRDYGMPGLCSFSSYRQCMEAASGRALSCNINPRVAFGLQQRRVRAYDPYRAY